MEIIYKKVQSNEKPLAIDVTSSPDCVYIRRDIKPVEYKNESGETKTRFEYNEAILTKSEYEEFKNVLIANEINAQENSTAFENYQNKLNTPVQYPINGFYYKPKWAEGVYAGLLEKGALLPAIFPLKIYDSTETEENSALFTQEELIALSIFLAQKQEQFFQEYKQEKVS